MDATQGQEHVIQWLSYWWPIWASGVAIFIVISSFMLGKLWRDRGSINESVLSVKSGFAELKKDLSASITNLGIDIHRSIDTHGVRISALEAVNNRWDGGHKLDQAITQLQSRQEATSEWMASIRTNLHELRGEAHNINMNVILEVESIKKEIAVIGAVVGVKSALGLSPAAPLRRRKRGVEPPTNIPVLPTAILGD